MAANASEDDLSVLEKLLNAGDKNGDSRYALRAAAARLRAVNRESFSRLQAGKRATAEAKQALEATQHELLSLEYEKSHLEAEIATHKHYRALYEGLEYAGGQDIHALANDHAAELDLLRREELERTRLLQERNELQRAIQAAQLENKQARLELETYDAKFTAYAEAVRNMPSKYPALAGQD